MFLKINGVEMPEVTEVATDSFTITESDRDDNGNMVHEFITKKQKIAATIGLLTHAQRQLIYNQLAVNKGLSLSVTFNDPETGSVKTINCYVGDRSIKLKDSKFGVPTHWSDFKLSLIEN